VAAATARCSWVLTAVMPGMGKTPLDYYPTDYYPTFRRVAASPLRPSVGARRYCPMNPTRHGIVRPILLPAILAAAGLLYLHLHPEHERCAGSPVASGAGFPALRPLEERCAGSPPPAEMVLQLGHPASVKAVAFSPDGKALATGSEDCTIKL